MRHASLRGRIIAVIHNPDRAGAGRGLAAATLAQEGSSATLQRTVLTIAAIYLPLVLVVAELGRMTLPHVPQIVTLYGSVLMITEGSTAFLLLGLARQDRAWPVLLLACAYLFAALMAGLHLLTYPGAILPERPLLGGPQAVSWLYNVWRSAFPALLVVAMLAEWLVPAKLRPMAHPGRAAALAFGTVLAATAATGVSAILWGDALPQTLGGQDRFTLTGMAISWGGLALSLAALGLAWALGRGRTLYLWLSLALLGVIGEIVLGTSAGGRYTLGWYAGRLSGLLAAATLFLFFLGRFAGQTRNLATALVEIEAHSRALESEMVRRAHAEERLLQARKMEALGQITGGIAHDFNNMLMVIGGRLRMLARHLPGAAATRHLAAMEQGLARCEGLTRQLLSFSRQRPVQSRIILLQEELPRLADLLRPSLRGDILLEWEIAPGTMPIAADPGELELALLNAALNARDAMPKGGRLRILVGNDRGLGADGAGPDRVASVRIVVEDNGSGIPPELLPRVFEPFFTTKEPGRGTGLGLSQIYGFARQSGGRASIASRPGDGTILTLQLPAAQPSTTPAAPADGAAAAIPAALSVLLVEDNDAVAEVAAAMLEELGCVVARASSGREALRRLQTGPLPGLVLSDIVMPGGMDGLELARAVRQLHRGLPVLLSTGYSSAAQEAAAEGITLLAKPYARAQLEPAMALALSGRAAGRGGEDPQGRGAQAGP
jgi:signal transduction histidine kinase/CheY-like chemotaxis protein